MSTVTTTETKTPTESLKEKLSALRMPDAPADYTELYTMAFKKTPNMPKTEVVFWFTQDKVAATEAGRKYCEKHGLRFIWVDRFCIDINAMPRDFDAEEKERDRKALAPVGTK